MSIRVRPEPSRDRQLSEDLAAFGALGADDIAALRRTCRAEPNVTALKRHYAGDALSDAAEWRDARVEIIAFPLSEGSRIPAGHPWAFEQFPDIDGPCIVARWRCRYPGRPGVLEVTWDGRRRPGTRTRRSVHFLGAEGSGADAARLMTLWIATTEAALRPHTRRRDRDFELEQAVRAAVALMGQSFHQPTREEVWEAVARSEMVDSSTIESRWKRSVPRITIGEVRRLAKERAPLLPLSDSDRRP